MKILKAIVLVFVVGCVSVFAYGLLKPRKYTVIPLRRDPDEE